MLENILQKFASSEESGLLKLSSDEASLLEALGQAYMEGMKDGIIKMAEAMEEQGEEVEDEVDPEEVIAAVEDAVRNGEIEPEEGAQIIASLDKSASGGESAVKKMWAHVKAHKGKYGLGLAALTAGGLYLGNKKKNKRK